MKPPEEEWAVLMCRVRDLAVHCYELAMRVKENGGLGRSVLCAEQLGTANKLCDELTAFVKARVAEAHKPQDKPATNGVHPKPAASPPPAAYPRRA